MRKKKYNPVKEKNSRWLGKGGRPGKAGFAPTCYRPPQTAAAAGEDGGVRVGSVVLPIGAGWAPFKHHEIMKVVLLFCFCVGEDVFSFSED